MIIGTRGSQLALAQSNRVSKLLKIRGIETFEKIIKTKGDIVIDKPLHLISGGYGAFVKELNESLEQGEVDIAVHSMKDIPTDMPENLYISAVLERDSPNDVLISNEGLTLDELPIKSIIGTSSLRRKSQILRKRSDLIIKDLRGNIDTRIRKLNNGLYDAIILSEAGIQKLGLNKAIGKKMKRLDIDSFCPSPNQGTIAIVSTKKTDFGNIISLINDQLTFLETSIERNIMSSLNVGCSMPVGVYSKYLPNGQSIKIIVDILNLDGSNSITFKEEISCDNIENQIELFKKKIFNSKAVDIIQEVKSQI